MERTIRQFVRDLLVLGAVMVFLFGGVYVAGRRLHATLYTFEPVTFGPVWLKGQLHAHSSSSDGDSPPDAVARWYREHGYQFVALTEHNHVSNPADSLSEVRPDFMVLPGEEVTVGLRRMAIHVGALGISTTVLPDQRPSSRETLQQSVDNIRQAGGLPIINHPNYKGVIAFETLMAVSGWNHLEVFNGHPAARSSGDATAGVHGTEQLWDRLLSSGRRVYGVATDDAHHFGPPAGYPSGRRAAPGRGWVMVNAFANRPRAVLGALETGRFYSSTGVTLTSVDVGAHSIHLLIRAEPDQTYMTRFSTTDGRVLRQVGGANPHLDLRERVPFVRAVVSSSAGQQAWLQPFWVQLPDAAAAL